MAEEISRQVEQAIDDDMQLQKVSSYLLASWFRDELLEPALANPDRDRARLAEILDTLHEGVLDKEENGGMTEDASVLRVVAHISRSQHLPVIQTVHPELGELLQAPEYAIHLTV